MNRQQVSERRERVRELRGRGWRLQQIADELGFSLGTVHRDVCLLGDENLKKIPSLRQLFNQRPDLYSSQSNHHAGRISLSTQYRRYARIRFIVANLRDTPELLERFDHGEITFAQGERLAWQRADRVIREFMAAEGVSDV